MSDTKQKSTAGFPILGVLGLIFITLKLTGHITWSWWWVLAPFWGGFVLAFLLFFLVVGLAGLVALVANAIRKP